MTKEELKAKLEASEEKLVKRLNTIEKLCKKCGINKNDLIAEYIKVSKNESYLKHSTSLQIVSKFVVVSDYYGEPSSDLVDNLIKLYEIEKIRNNWQIKYDTQKNKEDAPKIQVIWDFLNNWENKARDWYLQNAKRYFELKRDYDKAYEEYKKVNDCSVYRNDYRIERNFKEKYYASIDRLTQDITIINHIYILSENLNGYNIYDGYDVDEEKLNKILAQEKLAKYEDLCNRISAVVGEIQDASNLSIGSQNGEINGNVKGSKGTAKVETIGAGGYNIQCFHYRVLVHKI